jgi:hypothetical protein
MMSDCKHTDIDVYFLHDGTPAQFWACSNCMVKFVPITNELRLERDLAAAVERAERSESVRDKLSAQVVTLDANLADAVARADRAESALRAAIAKEPKS